MCITLKPMGDPEGVGRGVFFIQELLDPRLNIPYVRISTAGILFRREIRLLMHWKQYKGERPCAIHCTKFMDRINVCMGILS
jgi:hypothetical protein